MPRNIISDEASYFENGTAPWGSGSNVGVGFATYSTLNPFEGVGHLRVATGNGVGIGWNTGHSVILPIADVPAGSPFEMRFKALWVSGAGNNAASMYVSLRFLFNTGGFVPTASQIDFTTTDVPGVDVYNDILITGAVPVTSTTGAMAYWSSVSIQELGSATDPNQAVFYLDNIELLVEPQSLRRPDPYRMTR